MPLLFSKIVRDATLDLNEVSVNTGVEQTDGDMRGAWMEAVFPLLAPYELVCFPFPDLQDSQLPISIPSLGAGLGTSHPTRVEESCLGLELSIETGQKGQLSEGTEL